MSGKFEAARKNMVLCQLNTNGVLAPAILESFGTVPREAFLPDSLSSSAYADNDVVCADGAVMLEPLVHARMVQALAPHADESVLVIGDRSGYAAAVFSGLVSKVFSVEQAPGELDEARQRWARLSVSNVTVVAGKPGRGCPERAPYNMIFINGAVAGIPAALTAQLASGGRLVAVLNSGGRPMGEIVLLGKSEGGHCAQTRILDAAALYVPGFEPEPVFVL